jgi:hypothetical protein
MPDEMCVIALSHDARFSHFVSAALTQPLRAHSKKFHATSQQPRTERAGRRRHFPAITRRGNSTMPTCLRASEEKPETEKREPDWREPPGRLGEYVRRVKLLSDAKPARRAKAKP